MNVSAEKITSILDQIKTIWQVGPTQLGKAIGFSKQTIHNWKNMGASEKKYAKLESFLKNGPSPQMTQSSPINQFAFYFNLKIDLANPTDETKAQVAKAISVLEALQKIWT